MLRCIKYLIDIQVLQCQEVEYIRFVVYQVTEIK